MRALSRLLLLLLMLFPLAILALGWFALAETPQVASSAPLSHQDIARAEEILRTNDPRRLPPGTTGTVTLSVTDLNLATGYLLKRTIGADSEIRLADTRLALTITRFLPVVPMRSYLNIELILETQGQRPKLHALRIGQLPVPAPIARHVAAALLRRLSTRGQIEQAIRGIHGVELSPQRLRLRYQWNPALIDDAREALLTDIDLAATRFYHDRIVDLQQQGIGTQRSLSALLQPLFAHALKRSRNGDPVTENTALLSVLGAWAGRRGLDRLVPGDIVRPKRFRLRLRGRTDFAQHFLVSAALTARGDTVLSNAVGLFKEIIDTDRGSGFSFTDIAADLSGSRFGELATTREDSARRIQHQLAVNVADDDLLPRVDDLPEFLDSTQFEAQFEHVGSPAYNAMMSKINRRIAALPLYGND
jgi:hypothetical protein